MRCFLTLIKPAFFLFAGVLCLGQHAVRAEEQLPFSLEALAPISRLFSAPPEKLPEMLFDLPSWRGDQSFTQRKRILQAALLSAKEDEKDMAWLTLARFYFAQGLIPESLGALQPIRADGFREVKILKAACLAFSGNLEEAQKILSDPRVANILETNLLLGFVEAQQEHWDKAGAYFKSALPALADYPSPWRQRLRLKAAEALIETSDAEAASDYLDALRKDHLEAGQKAELDYLEARRLLGKGQGDKAIPLLQSLQSTPTAEIRVKAGLTLLDMQVATGDLDTTTQVQQLEELRYQWRGDLTEFKIMHKLGSLYFDLGRARKGLAIWQAARKHFPDLSQSGILQQEMTQSFSHFFISQAAWHLPPMDALSLYQDFHDLIPSGLEGQKMAASVSDLLVHADLLKEADQLLSELVEAGSGTERAALGKKLAEIRLMADDPVQALAALQKSDVSPLPDELKSTRKRLEAQARFAIGDTLLALNLLRDDDSEEGARARLAIYWQLREWKSASEELGAIINKRLAAHNVIDRPLRDLLFQRAVALNLAGDKTGLADLRRQYAVGFSDDEKGRGFIALTAPAQNSSIGAKMMSAQQLIQFVSDRKDLN